MYHMYGSVGDNNNVNSNLKPEQVLVWLYLNATGGDSQNPQIKIVSNGDKSYSQTGLLYSIGKYFINFDEPPERWFYEKQGLLTEIPNDYITRLINDAKEELDYSLLKYIGYFNCVFIGVDFSNFPNVNLENYARRHYHRTDFTNLIKIDNIGY